MKRYHRWLAYLFIVVLWLTAVNFANNSAQALMIDQKTGATYCVNMLAFYLGVPQSEEIDFLSSVSVILALTIPIVVLGLGLAFAGNKFVRRRYAAFTSSKGPG